MPPVACSRVCASVALPSLAIAVLVACTSAKDKAEADDAGSASFALVTSEFSVEPGEERSLCYATTLDEDLTIDRFDYAPQRAVHHFLLAKTLAPEPDGMHECGALFRFSWVPLFGSGNGESHLELPAGAAQVLPAGTQLLVQLHLFNTEGEVVRNRAQIGMRRAKVTDPEPVGVYAFGTDRITLPPGQTSEVTDTCVMPESVELFAVLPHMHYLGRSLTFELAAPGGELLEVYRRDPWNFDDQFPEDFRRVLEPGTTTRTTCSYENTGASDVAFGESSEDEMCFLVGFAVGRESLGGCLTYGDEPPDGGAPADAGAPCEPTENALGIGRACTLGGGECPSGLSCTADQTQSQTGFCLQIGGCSTAADCGGGEATCCAPAQGGGAIHICVPESCRPSDCTVVP